MTNRNFNVFNEMDEMVCPVRAETVTAGANSVVGIFNSSTRFLLINFCSALELIRAWIGNFSVNTECHRKAYIVG